MHTFCGKWTLHLFSSYLNIVHTIYFDHVFSPTPTSPRFPPTSYSPNFMFFLALKQIKKWKSKRNNKKIWKKRQKYPWSQFCIGLKCGWCTQGHSIGENFFLSQQVLMASWLGMGLGVYLPFLLGFCPGLNLGRSCVHILSPSVLSWKTNEPIS